MCIRDSRGAVRLGAAADPRRIAGGSVPDVRGAALSLFQRCLLYTSDAADERSRVDLGGRRIIKKKNNEYQASCSR